MDAFQVPEGECKLLPHPKNNPAISNAYDSTFAEGQNYSGEQNRANVLSDLIYMSFVCNLNSSAVLQFTSWKSYLNIHPLIGVQSDIHALTHQGKYSLEDLGDLTEPIPELVG